MLFSVVLNVISARTPTKSRPASQPWLVPAGDPWRTGASGGGTTRETSPPSTRSRCTEPRRSPGRRSAASWPGATRGTRPSCGPCRGRRPKALGARHFVIKSKSSKGTHIQLLTVNVTPLSRLERQPGCFKVRWRRVEVLELNHEAVQLCRKYHLILNYFLAILSNYYLCPSLGVARKIDRVNRSPPSALNELGLFTG